MFKAINAVQIHVSLDEIEPEIWRRLVLPSGWTLEQLHLAIQAAFNWWNYHLHEFNIGGLRYGDVELLTEDDAEDDPRVFNCHEVRLRDFGRGALFNYVYDFGDNWSHTVAIEELVALEVAPKHGTCIDGARARPPEDVGGISGYERFLESCRTKQTPNTPTPSGGVEDISIGTGSTWPWWTRMSAMHCARMLGVGCISQSRSIADRQLLKSTGNDLTAMQDRMGVGSFGEDRPTAFPAFLPEHKNDANAISCP